MKPSTSPRPLPPTAPRRPRPLGLAALWMAPAAVGLATLVACQCGAPSEGPSDATPEPVAPAAAPAHPDVVLITLDTTRADHLPFYGYFRDTAPRLGALATSSLVFDRFVVPMATTLPTHTSLLTGTWPIEHGVQANVLHGGARFVPNDALRTVTQWLGDLGYRSGAFVSAAPLVAGTGVDAGFDHYDAPTGYERKGDRTADAALAWLAEQPAGDPLFLWVHFYDPHNPFRPPPAYADRFRPDAEQDAWMAARQITPVTERPTGGRVVAKRAISLYDAEIAFMDDQVARVLDGLDARGRLDDALLIVVGDHGEGLNQHGQPGHGLVWGEQLHAPLMIRAPGLTPGRTDRITSAADVLPTALALVDLPGRDAFLQQASGADVLADGFEERPVLSQTSARQLQFDRDMTYAYTDRGFKCRLALGETREVAAWDLTADPFELAPLGPDRQADIDACVEGLERTLADQIARAEALGSGKTEEMDPGTVEALRALGYLDDEPHED